MAAAMNVTYQSVLTLVETLATGVPAQAANQTITQTGFNKSLSLTGTSTPNTKKGCCANVVLSSGVATIDMTSLTGSGGGALSISGSKGRFFRFQAPVSNGAGITVSKGASNGFAGVGAAFSVLIPPGGEFMWYDGGNGTAVDGTHKTFDLAGTGSTDNLNVEIVAGD
jgi:hypothetical protein